MKAKYWSFILVIFIIGSCSQPPLNMGMIEPYMPAGKHLTEGIVSKFYKHYTPKNKDRDPYTDISYLSYKFDPPYLLTNNYNAAFELISNSKYQITEANWILSEYNYYFKDKAIPANILEGTTYDWTKEQARSLYSLDIPEITNNTIFSEQIEIVDTIVDNKNCKKIKKNEIQTIVNSQNDTTVYKGSLTILFAPKIGQYAIFNDYDKLTVHYELVEQMSLDEFEKRANHGKKRMAYIDPQNTIDDHRDFKICNGEKEIGDYYNCEKRGELRGGKGTWRKLLDEKLNPDKLNNESGYLTFRFVLNCKGEVGRFITESSNLDFEKKKFNEETIQHLYEIVSSQTDWQVCSSGTNHTQDSYTYITFKLKDGKIIDLLP